MPRARRKGSRLLENLDKEIRQTLINRICLLDQNLPLNTGADCLEIFGIYVSGAFGQRVDNDIL